MGTEVAQVFITGIPTGAIYALVSVGITLVFGITRIVNFAHGAVMAVGAYVVYLMASAGGSGVRFWIALICAGAVAGGISFAIERGIFRFTLSKPINGFIVSLGIILIIENLLTFKFGPDTKYVPAISSRNWNIGTILVPESNVIIVGLALILFGVLYVILNHTRPGIALRAASVDQEMLSMLGVPVRRLVTVVFVIGGVLAGIAGGLVATAVPLTPNLGDDFIVKGFAVALIGGLGNVGGALLGGLAIGIIEATFGIVGYGAWVDAAAFGAMIVVLIVRPQGLLGGAEGQIR